MDIQGASSEHRATGRRASTQADVERIQAEAAGHYRVALKMHFEKPEIRVDVQFGHQAAFAIFAVIGSDVGDTVDHQHFVDGQAHGAGVQLAVAAADQVFFVKVIRIHVACVSVAK